MVDDEFLKNLHHVLFEVRIFSTFGFRPNDLATRYMLSKVLWFAQIANTTIPFRMEYQTWSVFLVRHPSVS